MSGNLYKLPIMIVALVIGIIMVTTAVLPLASDYSEAKTFTNDGYYYMQKITAEDTNTYTITYEYDVDTQVLSFGYNGDPIDTSGWPTSPYNLTIATDESWTIRVSPNNEYVGMQASGYGFAWGGHNTRTVSVSFTEGVATANRTYYDADADEVKTASPVVITYDHVWLYSPTETDYIMKKVDSPAYMLEDSEFLAVGITAVTTWNTVIKITGDVEDFTATITYPPNLTTTVTNKNIVKSELTYYTDLYQLDKLTFTINDGTTTVDATYSYFIVPAEVTADPDNPAAYKSLVMVIPLMAFVVLVVAAAAMIYWKKD